MPKIKGKRGWVDDIYNVVNINKAINDNIYTWGFLMGPIRMELCDG